MVLENDKTQFTLEHAQILYQTLADIFGEKYNLKIVAKVEEKWTKEGETNEKD